MLITDDACTKTGCTFQGFLQEKHSLLHKLDTTDPFNLNFELYEEIPDAVFLEIFDAYVEVVERHLRSAGRPEGTDPESLKDWLTHFSSESEHHWEELDH